MIKHFYTNPDKSHKSKPNLRETTNPYQPYMKSQSIPTLHEITNSYQTHIKSQITPTPHVITIPNQTYMKSLMQTKPTLNKQYKLYVKLPIHGLNITNQSMAYIKPTTPWPTWNYQHNLTWNHQSKLYMESPLKPYMESPI